MTFLGVDPGVGGGLACLTADGGVIWAIPMPQTDEALLLALRDAGPTHRSQSVERTTWPRSRPVQGAPAYGLTEKRRLQ
jgi:hypothetical protein